MSFQFSVFSFQRIAVGLLMVGLAVILGSDFVEAGQRSVSRSRSVVKGDAATTVQSSVQNSGVQSSVTVHSTASPAAPAPAEAPDIDELRGVKRSPVKFDYDKEIWLPEPANQEMYEKAEASAKASAKGSGSSGSKGASSSTKSVSTSKVFHRPVKRKGKSKTTARAAIFGAI